MGGFTGGGDGGTGSSGGPEIPIPDFVASGAETAQGIKQSGLTGSLWADFWGYLALGWTVLWRTVTSLLDGFLSLVVDFFTTAQGTNTAGFFALVASLVSDLLGIEVSGQHILDTFKTHGQLSSIREVGGTLYDTLAGEFAPSATLSPDQGEGGAKAFLGFLIEFAVRQGNVSFLQSIFPFDWLEGVREYGETMGRNLGLGRMARQAMHPLIQTVIADPLQWQLNQKYRPKILAPAEAVRAFNRGLIGQDLFNQEMAWAGYTDERIKALQQDNLVQLAVAEVYELLKWGKITEDVALALLSRFGYDGATADHFLAAERVKEADPHIAQLLSVIRTQRVGGFIDAPTFRGVVDSLPLGQEAKDRFVNAVGQEIEFPRRRLTLAEAQAAFVDGIFDATDLDAWLAVEGYDDLSHQTLFLQTLLKLNTQEAKDAVAQFKYDKAVKKAQAAGQPIPPPPPGVKPAG